MPVGISDPQQRIDPQPGFGFAVQAGDTILGWFTECGALTIEREIKPQPEGGVNNYIHQLPGRLKRLNITLKHGLAGQELWQWFQQGLYDVKIETRNVSVVLYDGALTEVRRWDLVDVYPAKWNGSSLSSAKQEFFIESVEFAYAGSSPTVQREMTDNPESNQASSSQPAVDIQALTRKVYQLLKEELRVERERLGHS